jgi:hypothetical protein
MVKPAPVIEAEFTVTAEAPDDVSVTEPVVAEFTVTLPKLTAEALSVNFGCRCRPGFADALPGNVTNAKQQMNATRSAPRRRLSQVNPF